MSQSTTVEAAEVSPLNEPAGAVEGYLAGYLRERPLPENLREAIEYAVLGGGKRLRPILVVRSCEAVGGRAASSWPAAVAIELVHAFSLVHDDLPAMDDDDLRRGRPTLHRHAGEAMAILAGDAMSSLAIELLLTRVEPAELAARVARELVTATNDMIAGQVYDTLPAFEAGQQPLDRLMTIHRHKTGALLRAACRMGAILGGASEQELAALTRYADAVGLMFQVVDDLLDVTQTTEQLGKTAGKDARQAKLTYPGVLGVKTSRAEVARLHREAMGALATLGEAAQPLRDLTDYMAVRQR